MKQYPLHIVSAVSQNGVIGDKGKLPWYLPEDLKNFQATTWGKPCIMGKKTFESLPRLLEARPHIVVSRTKRAVIDHGMVWVVPTWERAKETASVLCEAMGALEACVIGGEQLYKLALPEARYMTLNQIHRHFDGDVCFPPYTTEDWDFVKDTPLSEWVTSLYFVRKNWDRSAEL